MGRPGRVGLFLQARIESTRLRAKALLKLGSETTVGCAMRRLKKVDADFHVLVTDNASYNQLILEAEKYGFLVMAGPADDVLKRYALAAAEYNADTIIRATGDNPLVFAEQASLILDYHIESSADYSCFTGMPLGAGVEIFRAAALFRADKSTEIYYDREHVTPFIYNNPQIFKLNRIEAGCRFFYPEGRITLDTDTDYRYLKQIFKELDEKQLEDCEDVIEWIKKNPYLVSSS